MFNTFFAVFIYFISLFLFIYLFISHFAYIKSDEPEKHGREEAHSLERVSWSFALMKCKNNTHCRLAPETVITVSGRENTAILTEEFILL